MGLGRAIRESGGHRAQRGRRFYFGRLAQRAVAARVARSRRADAVMFLAAFDPPRARAAASAAGVGRIAARSSSAK